MTRRPTPFVTLCLTTSLCIAAMLTVGLRTRAGSAAPRIVCRSCLTPAPLAAARARDVVGTVMPPLHFDRWLNTDGNRPLATAGKVTLYRWWTDGCAHCEKTLPAIETLRREYGASGLQVVAVYHPKPPAPARDEDVRRWAHEMGYDGAIALDLDWSELRKFYLDTAPRPATSASFLVGKDGVIRFVHPGPRFYPSSDPADSKDDADYRRLEGAVKQLINPGS
jgi:thiol-disulfide isomerase/thioredoxin